MQQQRMGTVPNFIPNEFGDENRFLKPLKLIAVGLAAVLLFTGCFMATFQYFSPKFTKMFALKPIPPVETLATVRAMSFTGTKISPESVLTTSVDAQLLYLDDYYTDAAHPGHALYYDTATKKVVCLTELIQGILVPKGLMTKSTSIKVVEYAADKDKAIVVPQTEGAATAYCLDFNKKTYQKLPNNFTSETFVAVDKDYKKIITTTARSDSKVYKNILVTDISTGTLTNVTKPADHYLYNTVGMVTVSTGNRFINITYDDPKNPDTARKKQVLFDLNDKTYHPIDGTVISTVSKDRYAIFTNNADQKIRIYDAKEKKVLGVGNWPRLADYEYFRLEETQDVLFRVDMRTGKKLALTDRAVAAYKQSAKGEFLYYFLADLKQLFSIDIGTLKLKELTLPKEFLTEIKKIPADDLIQYTLFTENNGTDLLLDYYNDDYRYVPPGVTTEDPGTTSSGNTSSSGTTITDPKEQFAYLFNNANNLSQLYQLTKMSGLKCTVSKGDGFSVMEVDLKKGRHVAVEDYRTNKMTVYFYKSKTTVRSNFTICSDYSNANKRVLLVKDIWGKTSADEFARTVGGTIADANLDYAKFYTFGRFDPSKVSKWVMGATSDQQQYLADATQIECSDSKGNGIPVFDVSNLPQILEVLNRQSYHTPSQAEITTYHMEGKDPDTVYCYVRNSRMEVLLYFYYSKKARTFSLITSDGIAYISRTDYELLKQYCPVATLGPPSVSSGTSSGNTSSLIAID